MCLWKNYKVIFVVNVLPYWNLAYIQFKILYFYGLSMWVISVSFVDMHFLSLSVDSFPSACFLFHFCLLFVHYYYFNLFFPVCFLMRKEKKLYVFWREERWTQSWKMERRNSYPNIQYTLKDLFSIIKYGTRKTLLLCIYYCWMNIFLNKIS